MEGISKKPVRVCDTCYNKLCQGMSTTPNTSNNSSNISNNNNDNDSSDNSDEDFQDFFEAVRLLIFFSKRNIYIFCKQY